MSKSISEIINQTSEKCTNIKSRKEVREIIDLFIDEIRIALKDGEKVSIKDLGTFTPKTSKARTGRNPRTGETIEIPERKSVTFKTSPNFIKNILNGRK